MDGIWSAIIGVVGTGFLSLLGAVLMGKLVPVSRVEKAEKEADTWKRSHDTLRLAYDTQANLLAKQQLTAEVTDKVMAAVRAQLERGSGA